jgi:hypothetical protein
MTNTAKKDLEMEVVNLKVLEIYLICLAWAVADKRAKDLRKLSRSPDKLK